MLGTAVFVALGCGNVVEHISNSSPAHLNTVISFSFGIATSIIIFGPISGALMNPALNIAAVISGHMSLIKCLYFTIFQLLGGILGVLTVKLVTPNIPDGFCVTMPNPDVGVGSAFAVEFLTSGVLSLGLCHVLDPRQSTQTGLIFAKFLVIVTAIAVPAAKYGGCSMNPARSFGPALLSSTWDFHWIYWTATCLGAIVAASLYRAFFEREIYEDPPANPKRDEVHPI
uniref:Uncharacterized protein n=2 Tax=Rhodnius TaxID=13248 RepID=T1HH59_RHOPR